MARLGRRRWRCVEEKENKVRARNLFDYVEIFLSPLPEAVRWLSAQTPAGFTQTTARLIANAVSHLEENGNNLRASQENTITCAAIGFLNRYGIQATSQTNSRGHVDIFMKHSWQATLVTCGEAKIWRGCAHHTDGLNQLLGYTTGRHPFCFLLAYVKTGQIKNHIETLQQHLDSNLPNCQQGSCSISDDMKWALLSDHEHTSGELVRVLHAGVNLV
jgi:hypothetical protein